jgi:hypothetical protein
MNKTIILVFTSEECENWSHALSERHKLSCFRMDKPAQEAFHNLYFSQHNIRVTIS